MDAAGTVTLPRPFIHRRVHQHDYGGIRVDLDSPIKPLVINRSFRVSTAWVSYNRPSAETGVVLRLVQGSPPRPFRLPVDSPGVTLPGVQLESSASLKHMLNFRAPLDLPRRGRADGLCDTRLQPPFSCHVIELALPTTQVGSPPLIPLVAPVVACAPGAVVASAYRGASRGKRNGLHASTSRAGVVPGGRGPSRTLSARRGESIGRFVHEPTRTHLLNSRP
jgi:hypothetical protein